MSEENLHRLLVQLLDVDVQIILDALAAASAGSTVANTVVTTGSATASDLNVGKIIAAKKAMDAKNVPTRNVT